MQHIENAAIRIDKLRYICDDDYTFFSNALNMYIRQQVSDKAGVATIKKCAGCKLKSVKLESLYNGRAEHAIPVASIIRLIWEDPFKMPTTHYLNLAIDWVVAVTKDEYKLLGNKSHCHIQLYENPLLRYKQAGIEVVNVT